MGKGSWRPLNAFPGSGFFPGQRGCPWTQPVTALENLFLDRAKSSGQRDPGVGRKVNRLSWPVTHFFYYVVILACSFT